VRCSCADAGNTGVRSFRRSQWATAARDRVRPYANRVVAARLCRHGRNPLADEVRFVRSFNWLGFHFNPFVQVESELLRFVELVCARRPRTIVEIGTARGETAFLLARAAAPDARIVCVDLPAGPFGGVRIPNRTRLWASFAVDQQTVTLLERDSHDPRTAELVRQMVGPIDVLFIDGDHSYEGVAADFRMFVPMVADGGLIALHDIVSGRPEAVGGVPDFWHEVRGEIFDEIVADRNQGGYGFGLLVKGVGARALDNPAGAVD
jgi:predicted O-methyltransferase YrrM